MSTTTNPTSDLLDPRELAVLTRIVETPNRPLHRMTTDDLEMVNQLAAFELVLVTDGMVAPSPEGHAMVTGVTISYRQVIG